MINSSSNRRYKLVWYLSGLQRFGSLFSPDAMTKERLEMRGVASDKILGGPSERLATPDSIQISEIGATHSCRLIPNQRTS